MMNRGCTMGCVPSSNSVLPGANTTQTRIKQLQKMNEEIIVQMKHHYDLKQEQAAATE